MWTSPRARAQFLVGLQSRRADSLPVILRSSRPPCTDMISGGTTYGINGVPLASAALGFGSLTCCQLFSNFVPAFDRFVSNSTV